MNVKILELSNYWYLCSLHAAIMSKRKDTLLDITSSCESLIIPEWNQLAFKIAIIALSKCNELDNLIIWFIILYVLTLPEMRFKRGSLSVFEYYSWAAIEPFEPSSHRQCIMSCQLYMYNAYAMLDKRINDKTVNFSEV